MPKTSESVVARESQHTQLPWHVSAGGLYVRYRLAGDTTGYNVADCDMGAPKPECEANAEFIVRACNSHTKLVEALQAARNSIIAAKHPLECPNDETARGLALMELRDRLEAINVLLTNVEAL